MSSDRPQKITFAEMRESGVRGLLIYCADYRCSHSISAMAGPMMSGCAGKCHGSRVAARNCASLELGLG
jgi:hypothetical protein